jgi:hypothetical protein
VGETWHDLPPFPSHIRPGVLSELARLAEFPAGQFRGERVLDVNLGKVRWKWTVAMTSADGECRLSRIQSI